jgi:hypothetical protein
MSITVDYFFNFDARLATVAEQINSSIGSSLLPYQGVPNDFYCRFLGMDLDLQKPEFENDGELNFEDYSFHLSLRTSVGMAPLRPIQIPAMAFMVLALGFRSHVTGMLVFDGQILLARYEERLHPELGEERLYDIVSDEFVAFPSHLNALASRLPKDS